jgi:acetolactate synthase-1/2/3 large subunit
LETAVRNNINVVTVVNNNSALSQDSCGDLRYYEGVTGGNPDVLWRFTDVNFAKVAESIGCFGIRVERPGDIQSALEQAFASGRPAVVDVVTDPNDSLAPTPWSP